MKFNGAPFLFKEFTIQGKVFRDSYLSSEISGGIEGSRGYGLRYNKISALKASIGEHVERTCSLYQFSKKERKNGIPLIDCFSLITGEPAKVAADKILMNYNLPMFRNLDKDMLNTDSCGLASHIKSVEAIKSSLKEFIERQSLVASWLTRNPGEKVCLNEIRNTTSGLNALLKYSINMSDNIYSYNISLIDGVYVILTIGTNEDSFSAGLGTDPVLEIALEKSLNEYLMILESCILCKKEPTSFKGMKDKYVVNFYSLVVEEFLQSYNYLIECDNYIIDYTNSEHDYKKWILDFKKLYNVHLYGCYLPHPMDSIDSKVVKVFSEEGFPHIDTEIFNPEEYGIAHFLPSKTFYNKYKSIPFA